METNQIEHQLVVKKEDRQYQRAACTCGGEQARPTLYLTREEAEAWHRMHVDFANKYGPSARESRNP